MSHRLISRNTRSDILHIWGQSCLMEWRQTSTVTAWKERKLTFGRRTVAVTFPVNLHCQTRLWLGATSNVGSSNKCCWKGKKSFNTFSHNQQGVPKASKHRIFPFLGFRHPVRSNAHHFLMTSMTDWFHCMFLGNRWILLLADAVREICARCANARRVIVPHRKSMNCCHHCPLKN